MRKKYSLLKWLSLALYLVAFLDYQNWLAIDFIDANQDVWIMIGASALAFYLSGFRAWLGLAIFIFGLALQMGWVALTIEGLALSSIWIMISGYITMFFNLR